MTPKPRRRRGLLADEIAKAAKVSRYTAKQSLSILKGAPELSDFVISGELKLRQAVQIVKTAPELIPYVVSGKLRGAKCDRVMRDLRRLAEPELTLEEKVERGYKQWLSRWPEEDRNEVHEIVAWMPSAKLADLIPSHEATNLAVENDLEIHERTGS